MLFYSSSEMDSKFIRLLQNFWTYVPKEIDYPTIYPSSQKVEAEVLKFYGPCVTENGKFNCYYFLGEFWGAFNQVKGINTNLIINYSYKLSQNIPNLKAFYKEKLKKLDSFIKLESDFDKILRKADKYITTNLWVSYLFIVLVTLLTIELISFVVCSMILTFRKESYNNSIIYAILNIIIGTNFALFIIGLIFGVMTKLSHDTIGFFDFLFSEENLSSENPVIFKKNSIELLTKCSIGNGDISEYLGIKNSYEEEVLNFSQQWNLYINSYVELYRGKEHIRQNNTGINYFPSLKKEINFYLTANRYLCFGDYPGLIFEELNKYTDLSNENSYQIEGPNKKFDQWVVEPTFCDKIHEHVSKDQASQDGFNCLLISEWTDEEIIARYSGIEFNYPSNIANKTFEYIVSAHRDTLKRLDTQINNIFNYIIDSYYTLDGEIDELYDYSFSLYKHMSNFSEKIKSIYQSFSDFNSVFSGITCVNFRHFFNIFLWELEIEIYKNTEYIFIYNIIAIFILFTGLFMLSFWIFFPLSFKKSKKKIIYNPNESATPFKVLQKDSTLKSGIIPAKKTTQNFETDE